jgi:hypothetical protein
MQSLPPVTLPRETNGKPAAAVARAAAPIKPRRLMYPMSYTRSPPSLARPSSAACDPTETSSTSTTPQTPWPNLWFCSTAPSSDTPSAFDPTGLSAFDRTTTRHRSLTNFLPPTRSPDAAGIGYAFLRAKNADVIMKTMMAACFAVLLVGCQTPQPPHIASCIRGVTVRRVSGPSSSAAPTAERLGPWP